MSHRPCQILQKFALAAPGADTDIFTAITPKHAGSIFRIGVSLASTSRFDVTVTDSTPTTKTVSFNSGTALAAACLYTFILPTRTAYSYNFRVHTNVAIDYLTVEEVLAGEAI